MDSAKNIFPESKRSAPGRSVLIPEKSFLKNSGKSDEVFFSSRPIFYLNSVNGQPSGSKSDFLGLSRVGGVPGENCILRSPVTELSINSISDGWKKCSLEIDLGGFFPREREIPWKSRFPMKITWVPRNLHFVLEFT